MTPRQARMVANAKRLLREAQTGKGSGKRPVPIALPVLDTDSLPCRHRGGQIDSIPCTSCGGNKTLAKVYACSIHKSCTVGKIFAGHTCCKECDNREPLRPTPIIEGETK